MSFEVRPDPRRPAGGHAILDTGGLAVPGAPLAILRSQDGQWLTPDGWQPARCDLDIHADAQGEYALPPGVVDMIEPWTNLEIHCDDISQNISWPATVRMSRVRKGSAGLKVAAAPARTTPPAPTPQPQPELALDDTPVSPVAPDDPPPQRKSRRALWLILLLVLLLIAGALAYVLWPETSAEDPLPPAPDPAPQEESLAPDPCDPADIETAMGQGYATAAGYLDTCAGTLSPDLALRIIERGVVEEDADALLRMARLRDPGFDDWMADDPAVAVGYYRRATAAGAQGAETALERVCTELATSDSPLDLIAYEDACSP